MSKTRNALIPAVLLLVACGETGVPAIVGDWFRCLDPDPGDGGGVCSEIGLKGSRFTAEGGFIGLFPEKSPMVSGDGYCHTSNPDLIYSYSWDGAQLVIKDGESLLNRYDEYTIDGDLTTAVTLLGEKITLKRVDTGRDRGPCSSWSPWVCPKYESQLPSDGCSIDWVCDNGTFRVECDKKSSYTCRCLEEGIAKGTFTSADLCQVLPPSQIEPINTACGWKLSIPSR